MGAQALWSALPRTVRIAVWMSPLLVASPAVGAADGPFALRIRSEGQVYAVGETIVVKYAIVNRDSVPHGVFLDDYCQVSAFQGQGGTRLRDHYDEDAQRLGSPPYPTAYASLGAGEEWQGQFRFPLEYGVIRELPQAVTKFQPPGEPTIVHEGPFIRTGCDQERDEILIPDEPEVAIELAVVISACDPNPLSCSDRDCARSRQPAWVARDPASGPLDLSVKGEFDMMSPDFENAYYLAMYCQHRAALRRPAWIGRLESNRVSLILRIHR